MSQAEHPPVPPTPYRTPSASDPTSHLFCLKVKIQNKLHLRSLCHPVLMTAFPRIRVSVSGFTVPEVTEWPLPSQSWHSTGTSA